MPAYQFDSDTDTEEGYGNITNLSSAFPSKARPPSSFLRRLVGTVLRLLLRPVRDLLFMVEWVIWLFSSITLSTGQMWIVLYSAIRITISLCLYLNLRIALRIHSAAEFFYYKCLCWTQRHIPRAERIRRRKHALDRATSLESWQRIALELDHLCGHDLWKQQPQSDDYDWRLLQHMSHQLNEARSRGDYRSLTFLLSQILHRQFSQIQSEQLYSRSFHGTKHEVEDFLSRVVEQLNFLCHTDFGPAFGEVQKLRFFQRARRNLGKSVLCLSGGGALAMYHIGAARAMIKGNCLPSIINGTSGGAIIAALIGTRTDEELRDEEFFHPSLCQRYGSEHRWLPTLQQQVDQFLKNRVLMDRYENSCREALLFSCSDAADVSVSLLLSLMSPAKYSVAPPKHSSVD